MEFLKEISKLNKYIKSSFWPPKRINKTYTPTTYPLEDALT
jgi:hypothetical protein